MKRPLFLRFFASCAILAWLIMGCSGGSGSPAEPPLNDTRSAAGGTISLGAPVETGNEIAIPVEFSDACDLYAMSFRVGFDPDGLRPIGVDWTDVVGDEDSTFQLLDRRGFVPLAFARFSGLPGIAGDGDLCTLRFRILNREHAGVWIIPDEEYLVARDSMGRRLTLLAGGESR